MTLTDEEFRESELQAGLTEQEQKAYDLVCKAAGLVMRLPSNHSMEQEEMAHAFHDIQWRLLARPTYRKLNSILP